MWAAMKERGIEVPKLSGQDTADILAYLYVAHYFDPTASVRRGAQTLRDTGCLTCHSVKGKGGKVAADFATSTVVGSPGSLVAGLWNHAPLMEASAQKQGVSWPVLQGRDLADIAAYLSSLGKRPPRSSWRGEAPTPHLAAPPPRTPARFNSNIDVTPRG